MKRTLALLLVSALLIAVLPLTALAEDTAITVWMGSWWEDTVPKIVEKFEADPANAGYKLVIETFPNNAYVEKIISAILGGTAPDVVDVDWTFLGALVSRNLLTEFTPDDLKDVDLNDFFPAAISSATFGGKMYALANRGGTGAGIAYNKAIFDKAGIPYPTDDWTLDDYYETLTKLKAASNGEYYPTAIAAATSDPANFTTTYEFMLWSKGGDYFSADGTAVTMDTPEAIASIEFLKKIYDEGLVPEGCINYTIPVDIVPLFTEGKIAMMDYGDSWIPTLKESKIDYGTVLRPDKGCGTGGWMFAVPVTAPNPDASKKFVKWFTQADVLGDLMIRTPARISTNQNYAPWNGEDYATLVKAGEFAHNPVLIPQWSEIRLIMIREVQKVLMGEQTAEQAGKAITEQGNALLKEGAAN